MFRKLRLLPPRCAVERVDERVDLVRATGVVDLVAGDLRPGVCTRREVEDEEALERDALSSSSRPSAVAVYCEVV